MGMKRQVQVALVGYGHLGKWHAEKVNKTGMAELRAIVEPFPTSAQSAREKYPDVIIASSLKEVINQVDAVVIATPTSLHAGVMREALEAGKHVFCEKPMVNSYREYQELQELIRQKNVVIQVGHSERFQRAWTMLKTDAYRNAVDTASLMILKRVAPFKGRAVDVDVAADLLIHDLDICLHLWQKWPTHVTAQGSRYLSRQYDYIHATLFFDDGKMAELIASRGTMHEERSLELIGREGTLRVDMFQRQLQTRQHGQDMNMLVYEAQDHLQLEHNYFYQSILEGSPVVVDHHVGAKIVFLIDAIRESITCGQKIAVGAYSEMASRSGFSS